MRSIDDIAAAIAALTDQELSALRASLDRKTFVVRGLLAWLRAATDWEEDRRRARSCRELPGPHTAAIDRHDVECSLVDLALLHAQLRKDVGAAHPAWHGCGPPCLPS